MVDIIDSMLWSYSRLNSFWQCPYMWYSKYVYDGEIHIDRKFYAEYGSMIHDIYERHYLLGVSKEELLVDYFSEFWNMLNRVNGKPSSNVVIERFRSGKNCIEHIDDLPYKCDRVERHVKFLVGDIKLHGFIDFVGHDDDGNIIIVDHKSADIKKRSNKATPTIGDKDLDHRLIQLYLYALALKQNDNIDTKRLVFNCFRTCNLIVEEYDHNKMNDAIEWVKRTVDAIKNESRWRPNINFFYCKYICDIESSCEYIRR